MSSEFVARMHALSSLMLTPAMEVTSFMSSSSLLKRNTTFYASFRMDTKKRVLLSTSMFTYFGGYLYTTGFWCGSVQVKKPHNKPSQFIQVSQMLV